jgi:hypothetical protein
MDSPQKIDVVDWQDSPPPVVVKKHAPRRFLPPSLIGILGTMLLHLLAIQSVPFGSAGPKAKPPEIQESADVLSNSRTDSAESLVLISLPTMAVSNQAAQNFVSSLPDLTKMKVK